VEDAIYYTAGEIKSAPAPDSTIKIMTWNIRFCIGRSPWFGDACGDITIYTKEKIMKGLDLIVKKINQIRPDVLLLQEVDILSTRSAYVEQMQYILDHTWFNYGAFGSQWKAQFIPSDGLGRIDEGNVILSRWPISDAKRIQLALRNDQSGVVRYFYERCCMVTGIIRVPGFKEFSVVNIHASAFATDDTKHNHIEKFKENLDYISSEGGYFVAGGDLNTLPPGSDSTDYCIEDMCPGESFHHPGDNPMHKDGSNYTPEQEWLVPLYNSYSCAVPLERYQNDQPAYFTHTTRPGHFWDRTLDYLFTNNKWVPDSNCTHQDAMDESDHCPVSAEFILIRN
jgi:endonuclease/exonuclease/phosphatase family metal-dependent hydrolase